MDLNNISKKEFNDEILKPLSKSLNLRIEFNNSKIKQEGYTFNTSKYLAMSFEDGVIVLLWKNDRNRTLSFIFHEIGHILLHSDKKIRNKITPLLMEVEAETFAMMFMKEFNINVIDRNEDYIKLHELQYRKYCNDKGLIPNEIRQDELNEAYQKIIPYVKSILEKYIKERT